MSHISEMHYICVGWKLFNLLLKFSFLNFFILISIYVIFIINFLCKKLELFSLRNSNCVGWKMNPKFCILHWSVESHLFINNEGRDDYHENKGGIFFQILIMRI